MASQREGIILVVDAITIGIRFEGIGTDGRLFDIGQTVVVIIGITGVALLSPSVLS